MPRCRSGARSGTAAVVAASTAFPPACTTHHAMTIRTTAPDTASASRPSTTPAAPAATHGTRRPNREVVRSEKAPNSGFAITATADPMPDDPEHHLFVARRNMFRLLRQQHLHRPEERREH